MFMFQFDIGVMNQVRQKLSDSEARCSDWRSSGKLECPANGSLLDQVVVFTARIIARRTDEDGQILVLQHWTPENL